MNELTPDDYVLVLTSVDQLISRGYVGEERREYAMRIVAERKLSEV